MKSLPFNRNKSTGQVTVACANGDVSVYTRCAYCSHCEGVQVGRRVIPASQKQVLRDMRVGASTDEGLMNAAMMFNTLVRDGSAILCNDDANEGFHSLYLPR